jgi:hypothetical protein
MFHVNGCVAHALLLVLLWVGHPDEAFGAEVVPSATSGGSGIDLRPAFAGWGLPQRLQGNRGTCSVFTLVGALEYARAWQLGRGTTLSVEFVNWASNAATTNSGDGGFFSDLWAGFIAYGACAEADLPY